MLVLVASCFMNQLDEIPFSLLQAGHLKLIVRIPILLAPKEDFVENNNHLNSG
jgi:hypothetical protein